MSRIQGSGQPVQIAGASRDLLYSEIGIAAAGNTIIFTPAAGLTFYIMKLLLSATGPGIVNVRGLSGANSILGNAVAGISLFAQGGYVESSDVMPILMGAAAGEAFILNLDAAIPVGGHVVWYEA